MYLKSTIIMLVRSMIGCIIMINQLRRRVKRLLAMADTPNPSYNFLTNDNQNYWFHKLQSKANLLNECKYCGTDTEEL